ncbi:MAG: hypothetical protein LBF38_09170 [Deltaproteobacteria bacterium]|jgi:hypothetical protein|nr:hypothetical protein [Deltaproteobacteria bacterium]
MRHFPHIFILKIIFSLALGGLVVMLLWNAVIPNISDLSSLSYFQALGLLILCRIFFGHFYDRNYAYKLHTAWSKLSPQERVKLFSDRKNSWKEELDNANNSWCGPCADDDPSNPRQRAHRERFQGFSQGSDRDHDHDHHHDHHDHDQDRHDHDHDHPKGDRGEKKNAADNPAPSSEPVTGEILDPAIGTEK